MTQIDLMEEKLVWTGATMTQLRAFKDTRCASKERAHEAYIQTTGRRVFVLYVWALQKSDAVVFVVVSYETELLGSFMDDRSA